MPTITGTGTTFAPGTIPYVRTIMPVSNKSKYYNPSRTAVLLLSGFSDVPGATLTADQGGKKISLTSRVTDQLEFEILTHEPRLGLTTTFVSGSLSTGSKGTASTYTVDDASILRPYDVIENLTTGEFLWVATVDTTASPNEITAYPSVSQTGFSGLTAFPWTLSNDSPATKTAGDAIKIVGVAFPEGSSSGNKKDTSPTVAVNYVQQFREDIGVTWEEEQQKKYGLMSVNDKYERAMGDLLIKMENTFIGGKINKESVNGRVTRFMQGIKGTISTNSLACSALVGGGADVSRAKYDQIAELVSEQNLSGKAVALVSGTHIRKLQEIMKDQVEVHVPVGSKEFGLRAFNFKSAFLNGGIDFIHHTYFDQAGHSDEMLVLDPSTFEMVSFTNGELGKVSSKKGLQAWGTASNDTLELQDGLVGWYSLDYRFEKANALISGITNTIAS